IGYGQVLLWQFLIGVYCDLTKSTICHLLIRFIIWCPCSITPNSIATFRQHGRYTWHSPQDFCPVLSRKEFLQTVNSKLIKLGRIFHFTGKQRGYSLRCAKHTSTNLATLASTDFNNSTTYIYERANMVFNP